MWKLSLTRTPNPIRPRRLGRDPNRPTTRAFLKTCNNGHSMHAWSCLRTVIHTRSSTAIRVCGRPCGLAVVQSGFRDTVSVCAALMDVDQTWEARARADPLEVVKFWWWSESRCGCTITFDFNFSYHCEIWHFWQFLVYTWQRVLTELVEKIYTSNKTHSIHLGAVPDPNQSRYHDPFPDRNQNLRSLRFRIKDQML